MKKKRIISILLCLFSTSVYAETNDVPNGMIIESSSNNGQSILVRKHDQVLTIDYSAHDFQMVIYDSPINKEKIGELKKKDVIRIKEIHIIDDNEMWFKISASEKNGYILFKIGENIYDFYADNLWQPVETIQSGEQTWHTLKCNQSFIVYTNLFIRDKPGFGGEKIGMITANNSNSEIVSTSEVTVEKEKIDGKTERWAKIEY